MCLDDDSYDCGSDDGGNCESEDDDSNDCGSDDGGSGESEDDDSYGYDSG